MNMPVGPALFNFLPLFFLAQILIYVAGLFFLISAIQFMKRKTELDEVFLLKVDRLIQLLEQKEFNRY